MADSIDDSLAFLSTLPARPFERRLARGVAVTSVCVFLALLPFARLPLPHIPAFIPIYESALVVNDLITAVLLYGQFGILRSRSLLVLAGAYLFTAFCAVIHGLSFPGLFSPEGLLGAGRQTTVWMYMFWHGGFPIAVLVYVRLCNRESVGEGKGDVRKEAILSAAAALALALVCAVIATVGHDYLPVLLGENGYTLDMYLAVSMVWLLGLAALLMLMRSKSKSVLNLWLMVVMCAWLADIALSAALNIARFDLGFYFGRLYGLLASAFVLVMLLLENGMLYNRLVAAHQRELKKSLALKNLGLELESTNTQLNESNRQLLEASRLKSEFLANMSHELRTPLNAIIGFSEILKDGLVGSLSVKQVEFTQQIFQSGNHLLSLINDILDLSKIEAGKMTLDLEPVELDQLLKSSYASSEVQATSHGIRLHAHSKLPGRALLADRRKLNQILYNLLSNAIKFTRSGGRVDLEFAMCRRGEIALVAQRPASSRMLPLPEGEFQHFLEIRVVDTGIGISQQDMANLFETFRQIETSLTRQFDGTGLGLAMIHQLAALHGGTVGLRSTPDVGTEFVVWLPWRDVLQTASAPLAGHHAIDKFTPRGPLPTATPRALIIEDDAQAAELLRLQLESAGFDTSAVLNYDEAMDAIRGMVPDLITLDLHFPAASGWDLLDALRADPQLANIPVVIVSIVADEHKGMAFGMTKVLQKPISRESLLAALSDLPVHTRQVRPLKVLIIDDEASTVEMIASHLQGDGYDLLRAHDGASAITLARQSLPDLIILDLLMPDVDGFQVIEALRQGDVPLATPILILTAKNITNEDKQRLSGRVMHILEKSKFDSESFLNEVQRAMHGAKSGNSESQAQAAMPRSD